MADNWSASTLTLANKGDWAKWSFDVPDAAAAAKLNGDNTGLNRQIGLRGALTAASLSAKLAVVVNDVAVMGFNLAAVGTVHSFSGWVSANRYAHLGTGFAGSFVVDFATPQSASAFVNLFAVGTNAIRIISFDNEDVEIDFLGIQVADVSGFPPFFQVPVPFPGPSTPTGPYGNDSASQSTPAGFAAHVNPDGDFPSAPDNYAWLLKAPDATTGAVQPSSLQVRKFCPAGAVINTWIRLHDSGGSPIVGAPLLVIDELLATATPYVTDVNGEAAFDVAAHGGAHSYDFSYGGDDDNAPALVVVPNDIEIGCNGWHVGRIGVG